MPGKTWRWVSRGLPKMEPTLPALQLQAEANNGATFNGGEAVMAMSDDVLPDAPAYPQADDEIRHSSLETQNALYRSILSYYANGTSDQGVLATFALECPDAATKALEDYQAQTNRIVDAVQEFLLADGDDTSAFQREMDRLLRLRGANSRPATGVKDARGSRRRR